MKLIETLSHIFSILFLPLLMPTYAMAIALWGTYLDFASTGTHVTVLTVTFALTAMLPLIVVYLLYRRGIVSDPGLNSRQDRPLPVGLTMICYLVLAFYLLKIHAPAWLELFIIGSIMAAGTMLLVSLKWKISGHATGVGGLCAFTFFLCYRNYTIHNNLWLFIASIFVAGCVMTARLVLDRHTLAQVVAGFFNGVIWVSLPQLIVPYID